MARLQLHKLLPHKTRIRANWKAILEVGAKLLHVMHMLRHYNYHILFRQAVLEKGKENTYIHN